MQPLAPNLVGGGKRVLNDLQRTRLHNLAPLPPLCLLSLFLSIPVSRRSSLTGEGGEGGAKSNDGEKSWSSKNHSILSGWGQRHQNQGGSSVEFLFHAFCHFDGKISLSSILEMGQERGEVRSMNSFVIQMVLAPTASAYREQIACNKEYKSYIIKCIAIFDFKTKNFQL